MFQFKFLQYNKFSFQTFSIPKLKKFDFSQKLNLMGWLMGGGNHIKPVIKGKRVREEKLVKVGKRKYLISLKFLRDFTINNLLMNECQTKITFSRSKTKCWQFCFFCKIYKQQICNKF
jgi:hypothetical protein